MGAITIGSLLVNLGLESGAFKSGLDATQKQLRSATRSMVAMGKSLQEAGQRMTLGITLPFAALAKLSVDAALESRDALGQVQASLTSMGNAAGRSVEQLQALARTEMRASLFDDDEILRKVSATLLTFGKVSGENFDLAQQAAIDLSAKWGGDLKDSAIQLGKALNDPILGLTALRKAGVTFDDQQREQIKTMVEVGNVAGAQKVVLAEMAKEVGGSAAAAAKANPFAVLKHSIDDFKEAVGGVLLQVLPRITDSLDRMLTSFNGLSPGAQSAAVAIAALAAAAGPLLSVIGLVTKLIAPFAAALGLIAGEAGLLAAARVGFIGLGATIGPVGLALGAAAAAVLYFATRSKDATAGQQALNQVMAADRAGALTGSTNALASARANLSVQTLKAALAEAQLQHTSAARALSLAQQGKREVSAGRAGMHLENLDTYTGRGGSEQGRAIATAEIQLRTVTDQFKAVTAGFATLRSQGGAAAASLAKVTAAGFGGAGAGGGSGGGGAGGGGGQNRVSQLAESVQGLVDRLFPAEAALRTFNKEFAQLEAGSRAGLLSRDKLGAALDLLQTNSMGNRPDGGIPKILQEWADNNPFETFATAAQDMAGKVGDVKRDVLASFSDMAQGTISSLDRVVQSIKGGGGFLDIMSSVLGLITQLGSIGLFGSKLATRINTPKIPAYAGGTSFHAGGMALVGERGPELVELPRGASVIPNGQSGGGGQTSISVEASPYFDVRVNGQIVQAAPLLAAAGGEVGVRRVAGMQSRSLR